MNHVTLKEHSSALCSSQEMAGKAETSSPLRADTRDSRHAWQPTWQKTRSIIWRPWDSSNDIAQARLRCHLHPRRRALSELLQRKNISRSIVLSVACGGQRLHHRLRDSSAIDTVNTSRSDWPSPASSDRARGPTGAQLSWLHGQRPYKADTTPENLRRVLVAALTSGVPLIIDLDPAINTKPTFDSALAPLCGATATVRAACRAVLLRRPAARFKLLSRPWVGRAPIGTNLATPG